MVFKKRRNIQKINESKINYQKGIRGRKLV